VPVEDEAAVRARVDVLDQLRPGGGAIRSPELVAVDAIVGTEEDCAVDGD